jgi:long-chain acyl-CoA synthetase
MNAIAELQTRPWHATYLACGINPELAPVEEKSLADYIETHARERGSQAAIEYLGLTISYAQLDAFANRLANRLRALGVKQGDVVGIHLPNTPQYLITLVASAKLGAIVSGVSPLLMPDEVAHQINDAKISVMVSLDQLYNHGIAPTAGRVPTLKTVLIAGPIDALPGWKQFIAYTVLKKVPRVTPKPMAGVSLLAFWPEMLAAPASRVYTKVHFDDTLYIQYTGGTTGKPKGAELTLRSMFSNARQGEAFSPYAVGADTLASAFPYFHMAGLALSLLGLQMGARLLVVPDPRNVTMLAQVMQKFPPTIMANVPTLYQMLIENPEFRKVDFSRLKNALSGAAPFPAEMIHKLEAIIGQGKLCEVYGMTETSPLITCNPSQRPKIGSVGVPVIGTDVKIVDVETGTREMPLGEPGELIASGPQLMKGYRDLPEASVKAMREFEGKTWMYTGDIASMDAEGYITICDRAKDMLIVGGFKVFSVEVEGKLAELDYIALSALIGEPDTQRPGNDIVHLYVQIKPESRDLGEGLIRERILAYCREHMAPYKVPKHIHFLDALPLTPVGKIDKKALRKQ